MVKAYLRYEPATSFGVIASPESNITYDSSGKYILSPALEKVGVWHVRQGLCTKTLTPPSSRSPSLAVTSIISSHSSSLVASGYADGSIRIWDCDKGTCETTLNGHKGAISVLQYNKSDSVLASGSRDGDLIMWDIVAETGLFRLRGHRDQVTGLVFLDSSKKLVSSSKDKFLRVWDLEAQHCMQIIGGHHSEIWSLDIDPEEKYVVTGSADSELRFYKTSLNSVEEQSNARVSEIADLSNENKWEVLKLFGEIPRQSKDRVAAIRFNQSGNLLACQVAGKTVDVFHVLDADESNRKAKRRLRRKKKKEANRAAVETLENGVACEITEEGDTTAIFTPADVFKLLHVVRTSKKICSISFSPLTPKSSLATLSLSLNNNLIEIFSFEKSAFKKTLTIELQGHRSDIRSLALSSDNTLLMSTSHNAVKIWNPSTGSCLRTVDSGFGLCCLFGPLNRFGLVGTKAGTIEIIDINSATCIDVVEAHGGSVQSIAVVPNVNGFVTGSADHDIKFWEFQNYKPTAQEHGKLLLSNVRTKTMNGDVLAVCISPDSRYIAVALLDNTVRVLFMDSLKVFLSLYGHKLPVLCLDISSDGGLIVTGSTDKNLKIWGLDFGDCHKSIFAHSDSVMAVQFVQNTHYVFSVGKDRLVKYWDADKFELLLTLEGHHAEIWCLTVSDRGDFIVTGSHDRSIRRWDRTEEPFFVEEEKEKRLEEMFESDVDNAFESKYTTTEEVPGEGAVAFAGKKTQETLSAADSIIDALDTAEAELRRISEHKEEIARGKVTGFQPNIFMQGLSPTDFILHAISNVQANDLDQSLLALPFSDALKLLSYMKDWIYIPDKVELVCRMSTILLQTHHNQLVSTPSALPALITLKDLLFSRVKECKDVIGFNLAAMDHMKQLLAQKSDALFRDAKMKLIEIRSKLSKRIESRAEEKTDRRKKRQKKSKDDHVRL